MATFFVSPTGNDSWTGTSATETAPNGPWATLTKVNSAALVAGDIVQFKRGGVWGGGAVGLNITHSGVSGNPITYTAYGTGANPEINGLATLSGWVSIGSNLWTATVPNFPAGVATQVEIVYLDGVLQPKGRVPKLAQGYYNTTSSSGTAPNFTITSTTQGPHAAPVYTGSPVVVGGEICYRPKHFTLWNGLITGQNATSVSFTAFASNGGGTAYTPVANYGFFLQNHPNCCTLLGEWAYTFNSTSSRTFTMNFTGTTPTAHTVQVATITPLVNLNASVFITFNNISFKGSNNSTGITSSNTGLIQSVNNHDITFDHCSINGAGLHGIWANGTATNWRISNSNMSYCYGSGIKVASGLNTNSGWVVTDNWFDHIYPYAGMGGSGEGLGMGSHTKIGAHVTRNKFTNCGHMPINWDGTNNIIQFNFIDTYGFVKDDAGGIYTEGTLGQDKTGSLVDHNIIINGQGAPIGTSDFDNRTNGLYPDDNSSNYEISHNTCGMIGNAGIYFHVVNNINAHHNTFFDCVGLGSSVIRNVDDQPPFTATTLNINFNNNLSFAKTASEAVWLIPSGVSTSWFATTTDTNHYCRPLTSDGAIFNNNGVNQTLAQWRTALGSPRELNSVGSPFFITDINLIRFEYNADLPLDSTVPLAPKTINLGAQYKDMFNNTYNGSITLQPFESAVLIQTGSIAPPSNKHSHGYIIS